MKSKSKLKNLKDEYLKRLEHAKRMKKFFQEKIEETALILNEIETVEGLLK